MNDIVVTLSGVISMKDMEGKTAEQLIGLAMAHWNIPKESIDAPFVTIHSKITNKHNPLQGSDVISGIGEDDVIRVILPLEAGKVEVDSTKQYLVE